MGKPSLDFLGEPPRDEGDPAGRRRERKLVTVLFCDLAGFTARSEQLDPEDVQALLESYFSRVRKLVERFGGTLEKFIGDAVMAVFGAPTAHEDDPERAVRAALAIRDTFTGELELRIAVHTGEALVTLDADPGAGQGLVVGDVVNTASRLQGFAPPGGVIVGDATYHATVDVIEYHALEPVVARGKRDPVTAWEARGERTDQPARGLRVSLVGRQRELDQLADALSRAEAERSAQLATVLGVPGIGKTRLVSELYRRVKTHSGGVTWLQGRSLPYGEGVTFWALAEIVKERAGIFEGDQPEAVDEKLRVLVETTQGAGDDPQWVLRHLRPLAGVGGDAEASGDSRDESFAAWRAFLEALAEQAVLVLVFEDLHWADEGLLDFIDELVERATDLALLVVCTSRPELVDRRPAWGGGKRNVTTISLAPLSEDETACLVDALLEGTALRPAASGNLVARAGGNPLYAEEYARLLLARGSDDDVALPDSLHALIAARLDGLPLDEKALVQDAAVVGETVWVGAVAAVGGRARATVEELVRPLERKEFLSRRRSSAVEGESEYAFHHVLVRDVAYGEIPRAERGRKHRLAAGWIESLGRPEDHAELLAHHYLSALELAAATREETEDLRERARNALTDAGERAVALGALHAAARHFGAALELLPEDDPKRPLLLLRQGKALIFSDIAGEEALLAASEAAAAGGNRLAAATAESLLGTLYQEQARGEEARARFANALELVEGLRSSPEKAEVLAEVARSLMMACEDEEAVQVGSSVLEIADELGLDELRAHALCSLGPARARLGDKQGGIRDLERAIEIAFGINSLQAARGHGNLRAVLADEGDLSRASEVRAQGHRLAERMGLRYYVRQSRFDELEDLYYGGSSWDQILIRADELAEERSFNATTVLEVRARIRLARGDGDGAASDAVRALALARASTDAQVLLPALATSSLVDISTAHHSEATSRTDELLSLVRSFGAPTAALIMPALSVVLHRLGRGDELPEADARRGSTPWLEAASAYVTEDFGQAAEIYGRIGSRPDEAYARLRAADRLASEGRRSEAAQQLEAALAFFRSVGATAYIREAERIVAAST